MLTFDQVLQNFERIFVAVPTDLYEDKSFPDDEGFLLAASIIADLFEDALEANGVCDYGRTEEPFKHFTRIMFHDAGMNTYIVSTYGNSDGYRYYSGFVAKER